MLLIADWVLPVDAPPIRDGAVLLHNGRVADVGPSSRLVASGDSGAVPRVELPGHVLLPGLVDAHTHLSLTSLAGLLRPDEFASWLGRVAPMIHALDDDDMAASATLGAMRCLEAGITVVGDIAYGPEAAAAAADMGLGGVFFWEVYGIAAAQLQKTLTAAEFPASAEAGRGNRTRCGISPHTAYTSSPELLRAEARLARGGGFPLAIHIAESHAETMLLANGSGPLAGVAQSMIPGFEPPGHSPVAYLERLGVLDGALAVHCVHLAPGDAATLARLATGVVLCPRSNAFLNNGAAPYRTLSESGARLALGTDSPASNDGIDLFAEARALRELHRQISAVALLGMMTLGGAEALGVAEAFGSLTPGKQADIIGVRTGRSKIPSRRSSNWAAATPSTRSSRPGSFGCAMDDTRRTRGSSRRPRPAGPNGRAKRCCLEPQTSPRYVLRTSSFVSSSLPVPSRTTLPVSST